MPGPEPRYAVRLYRAACVTLPMPRARPDLITASLHLEHVHAEALREKMRWLMDVHAGSVCVTCVATRDNLPRLPLLRVVFLRIAASHGQSAAPEPCPGASRPWYSLAMIIEHFPVAPLGCNCTILGDEERGEAMVVDPGGEHKRILDRLAELKLRCVAIVHTHTHFDHVGATHEVQHATDAPTMLHEHDLFLYRGLQMQLDTFGIPLRAPDVVEIDRFLSDGDTVSAGAVEAGVLHTPGHTPGSLCLTVGGSKPVLIAGDTLFRGAIGRTDLWGGDSGAILASIKNKLMILPEDTLVITGHGPVTTVGEERRSNPFLR